MNIPDKIYCINLDRRPDRWHFAAKEFDKHRLNVERFPAIDANDFKATYPSDNANNGCTLSHYFIVERAKLLGLDAVMIFEDDVCLHHDFIPMLLNCMSDLPENWDMLYLGGSHREKPTPVTDSIYRVSKTLTTHAYIIRNTIYDLVIDNFKNLNEPVDCLYAAWQKEYNFYITNPPLAWQRGGFSDIVGR